MKRSELFFTFFKLPIDILALLAAFIVSYFLRQKWEIVQVFYMWPFDQYLRFAFYVLPLWILVFAIGGLYKTAEGRKITDQILPLFLSISTAMMIILVYLFFSRSFFFSRLIIIYVWLTTFFFVLAGRLIIYYFQRYLYKFGIGVHRLVVVGANGSSKNLISDIQNNKKLGFKLVGIILKNKSQKTDGYGRYLGPLYKIEKILRDHPFDELLLADHDLSENQVLKMLEFCEDNKIIFKLCPNLFNVRSTHVSITTLAGLPIMQFRKTPLEGWGKIIKRITDIIVSFVGLIITSPIFLIIAIAIKLDSKGPILFRQVRVGPEKNFIFYKFRSMYEGAEKEHAKMMKQYGMVFKLKNDPRTTKFGKFLRSTSIDELPQLINVLKGDMSLVGPRPPMPIEVQKYNPFQRKRLLIKPGITGLWQTSGRSEVSFNEWVKLDLYYIENWSLWLDIQIIVKTMQVVLKRKGAY